MEANPATPAATNKKDDLKLCGEIDKRYAQLSGAGAKLLRHAITEAVHEDELKTVLQIVQRREQLTDDGKVFADKRLGVTASEPSTT